MYILFWNKHIYIDWDSQIKCTLILIFSCLNFPLILSYLFSLQFRFECIKPDWLYSENMSDMRKTDEQHYFGPALSWEQTRQNQRYKFYGANHSIKNIHQEMSTREQLIFTICTRNCAKIITKILIHVLLNDQRSLISYLLINIRHQYLGWGRKGMN